MRDSLLQVRPSFEGRILYEGKGQAFGPLEWRDDSIAAVSD